jgi:hypothetical protein
MVVRFGKNLVAQKFVYRRWSIPEWSPAAMAFEDFKVITVPHRIKTISNHGIIVLEKGEIIDHGVLATLLTSPSSLFSSLLKGGDGSAFIPKGAPFYMDSEDTVV